MSRKNTYSADSIRPTPMLNSTSRQTGYSSSRNFQVNRIWSSPQNTKKMHSVRLKLISVCTFLENRNRYLGMLTLVKMAALFTRDVIPWDVDSLK